MVEDRPEEPSETVTQLFDALSRSNCRYSLYYLRDRDAATVEELATVVSGWVEARETDPEVVTPDDRERVLVSLHHADLPYLEDAGLVRYDLDSKTAALEPLPEMAASILDKSLVFERLSDRTDETHRRDPDEE